MHSKNMMQLFRFVFAIREIQEGVNLLDLVKSFSTNIWLRKSASIQPRTSLTILKLRNLIFTDPLPGVAATPTAAGT